FQSPLAAIGKFDRGPVNNGRKPDIGDQLHGPLVQVIEHRGRTPEIERAATPALQSDAYVLQYGHVRKHCRYLERTYQSKPCDIRRLHCRDVLALEQNTPARRAEKFCQQVEAGRLAGAVWSNEGVNRPALDAQAYAVDGGKAGKLLGEILSREDQLFTHSRRPLVPHFWQVFAPHGKAY